MANKNIQVTALEDGVAVGLGPIARQIMELVVRYRHYIDGQFHGVNVEFNAPHKGMVTIKTAQHHPKD